MNRLPQAAILTRLAKKLRAKGSWCGETHVQKAVYLLQDMLDGPTDFEFILYKHGPFSFDLRDELTSLRADGLLELELQPAPYGPKLAPTKRSETIQQVFKRTVARSDQKLDFIADRLGSKGVIELERLATALYVTKRKGGDSSVKARASRLREFKPHVSLELATQAIEQVDDMTKDAKELLN